MTAADPPRTPSEDEIGLDPEDKCLKQPCVHEIDSSVLSEPRGRVARLKGRFPQYRVAVLVLVGCFFSGWWLSIIIQKEHRSKWLVPTALYVLIMVRLLTWRNRVLNRGFGMVQRAWNCGCDCVYERVLPKRAHRLLVGAGGTLVMVLLATFVSQDTPFSKRSDRAVSFVGLLVVLVCLYATSRNRTKIVWNAVIGGVLLQFMVALFVLRTKAGFDFFNFVSLLARSLLSFAKDGVAFLTSVQVSQTPMFFFLVLPSVAFFVAFVNILYYWGVVQWFVRKFASFFFWALRISGAEAITASASPFIGIGESAILIADLLPFLTIGELHQVMTSGFSTISGAVLVGYIGLGLSPQALVSSCVMSIPASIVVSKMRCPETEESICKRTVKFAEDVDCGKSKLRNALEAFSSGASLGLFTAATMLVQCLCIIALVSLVNGILTWFGSFWNINGLSLNMIFQYIFYPGTFLLGVPRNEVFHVSQLLAAKFIQNEYVAYSMLMHDAPYNEMSPRGTLIATYALCGFANLGSVGITLGVLNALSKGKRAGDIAKNVTSALFSGFVATMMTAAVSGMLIQDLLMFANANY
ncbi:concentrative Na+-nucleoside cotransporte [Metschnikowia bicuspidata]|uniref:Concentrative Na+-nucleoside cotransporte n=1 Tax=Metschnikowia bicuspidata TaxID=27322 RepID=A0A4P9ZI89_9ASCO|nr:concentrative Na+-nucleoside cotransporte [Metschnikowia bicuspidata]